VPRYDYKCPACGTIEDVVAHINEEEIECPRCQAHMATRLFSPPTSRPICDIEPYFDENLGKDGGQWVKSRRHKRQLMKSEHLEMRG
jgi:putative FmdB family regulatory protein